MKKWVLVALGLIAVFAAATNYVNACWGNGCRGGYDDYNYYYGNGAYGYGGYAAPGYYYVPPHYGYADYYPYGGYGYNGYGSGYAYSYSYSYSYSYGYGYRAPSYRNSEMEYYCRNGWC